MAQKNKLFEVDITKENPLKTIINNGKIPVVRKSKTGFQNYKQTSYEKSHNEHIKQSTLKDGCFVHLGGIQGNWISGSHYLECLNIGYVEPNTKVFMTYAASKTNTKNEFKYTTAKNKFEDVKLGYKRWFEHKEVCTQSDYEDFDICTEAIVNMKDVKKVLTLDISNFDLLIPYINDDYLRMYFLEDIFYYMKHSKKITSDFFAHVVFDEDLMDKDTYYRNCVLDEFKNFYTSKKYKFSHLHFVNYKKALSEMENFKNEFQLKYKTNIIYNNCNFWISFENLKNVDKREQICISYNNKKFIVKKIVESSMIFDHFQRKINKNYKTLKEEHTDLLLKDLINQPYLNFMFYTIKFYKQYKKLFSNFYELEDISILNEFEKLYNLLISLEIYNYILDGNNKNVIIQKNDFVLEYNLILNDFVIKIDNDYYNLENLPKNYNNKNLTNIIQAINSWYQKLAFEKC